MNCKNCQIQLQTDENYCHSCGAKVMRNRLTFKNLWNDFKERVLNLDNNFFRTFKDLFLRPHAVVDGYISGVRKKYMDPISYMGIALTFSGLQLFLLRKYFLDKINYDLPFNNFDPELARKMMLVSLDFNSFVFLLYIPVVALAGWVVYNKKSYLLSEYLVQGTYSLGHYSIFTTPVTLIILLLVPEYYFDLSFPLIALMAFYAIYVASKIHGFYWLRTLLFFFGFGLGFFALGILLNIIFLLSGVITLEDYIPKG